MIVISVLLVNVIFWGSLTGICGWQMRPPEGAAFGIRHIQRDTHSINVLAAKEQMQDISHSQQIGKKS